MTRKPVQRVIQISNPDETKAPGVVVVDLEDQDEAIEIGQKLAVATGRQVAVFDERLNLIETIPAATVH